MGVSDFAFGVSHGRGIPRIKEVGVRLAAVRVGVLAAVGALGLGWQSVPQRRFSPEEVAKIAAHWRADGRYTVRAPAEASKAGPWQVRLSVEGSTWLWNYNRARGVGKGPPTLDPEPKNPDEESWEKWIDAKVARDRWLAAKAAATLNAAVLGKESSRDAARDPEPPDPGPIPQSLLALAGNPPPFAAPIVPLVHEVRFEGKTVVRYTDNPPMRARYAYYRFSQGVMHVGKKVRDTPAEELDSLFKEAGVTPSERKVMAAVSMLEGGFESVNTYDTGFVSVGFIQFACLKDGAGSLGQVLLRHKKRSASQFEADFRRFGLDVTDQGALVALDPSTGAELVGAEAAGKIIDDKRLIAVFQRAGEFSRSFRVAQVLVAKEQYYPASDEVRVDLGNGKALTGKVSEFVRSEAGMATLMDRKVNTGKLDFLPEVLSYCAERAGAKSLKDLAKYERDIAALMKFRTDYLADTSLSQPGPSLLAKRDYEELASRRASRNARRPPE